MTKFHEGQEVEVRDTIMPNAPTGAPCEWRKARIVNARVRGKPQWQFEVELLDGGRAVFDVEHIRPYRSRLITNDPTDGYCPPGVCDYEEMGR